MMPMSMGSGLPLKEDGKGDWPEGLRNQELDTEASVPIQSMTVGSHGHIGIQKMPHLPSNSPSPSPRGPSHLLVATDSSRGRGISPAPNGSGYTGSFENTSLFSGIFENKEGTVNLPLPISKTLSPNELHDIPEEKVGKHRKLSNSKPNGEEKILKLTAAEMEELTSAPESLPFTSPRRPSASEHPSLGPSPAFQGNGSTSDDQKKEERVRKPGIPEGLRIDSNVDRRASAEFTPGSTMSKRPGLSSRAISTPPVVGGRMLSYTKATPGQTSPKRKPFSAISRPDPLDLNNVRSSANGSVKYSGIEPPSPPPQSIPIPPMSIPTYLQLELSSSRPSPLYIYRSPASEYPYESSKIKFERLLNFLLLPPQLEQVLYFGSLACLDAWLYTFTILPLRFLKAAAILVRWWGHVLATEVRFIGGFIYHGSGRMWSRQRSASADSSARSRSVSRARRLTLSTTPSYLSRTPDVSNGTSDSDKLKSAVERKSRPGWDRKHRRTKSQPSSLSSTHKADLLQGAVIICSCIILMKLDASRMYHSIRGQAAIKLYVIYNALEV
jgi:hypothetical protein